MHEDQHVDCKVREIGGWPIAQMAFEVIQAQGCCRILATDSSSNK
jgi:hypothetical protein